MQRIFDKLSLNVKAVNSFIFYRHLNHLLLQTQFYFILTSNAEGILGDLEEKFEI